MRTVHPACWGTHNPHPCTLFWVCHDVQLVRKDIIFATSLAECLSLVQALVALLDVCRWAVNASQAASVHLVCGNTGWEKLRWCAGELTAGEYVQCTKSDNPISSSGQVRWGQPTRISQSSVLCIFFPPVRSVSPTKILSWKTLDKTLDFFWGQVFYDQIKMQCEDCTGITICLIQRLDLFITWLNIF